LAAVLETGAGQADVGAFAARGAVGFPFEDGERASADLAFFAVVLFDHLHVRVFGEAVLADGGEVGGFPAGAVEVLLDLGRHVGGRIRVR
jgi:hypothetical protein